MKLWIHPSKCILTTNNGRTFVPTTRQARPRRTTSPLKRTNHLLQSTTTAGTRTQCLPRFPFYHPRSAGRLPIAGRKSFTSGGRHCCLPSLPPTSNTTSLAINRKGLPFHPPLSSKGVRNHYALAVIQNPSFYVSTRTVSSFPAIMVPQSDLTPRFPRDGGRVVLVVELTRDSHQRRALPGSSLSTTPRLLRRAAVLPQIPFRAVLRRHVRVGQCS